MAFVTSAPLQHVKAAAARSRRAVGVPTPVATAARSRVAAAPPAPVAIEAPARNRRQISSAIEIAAPREVVWELLTDYNNLATHVPNLALSRRRFHPRGGIRLEQCGTQSILGFEFKASVVMDMVEVKQPRGPWAIRFSKVESRDFDTFQGEWVLHTVEETSDHLTRLEYAVDVVPRGFVPVQAVEWRIREDIPSNLIAVQSKCEILNRPKA